MNRFISFLLMATVATLPAFGGEGRVVSEINGIPTFVQGAQLGVIDALPAGTKAHRGNFELSAKIFMEDQAVSTFGGTGLEEMRPVKVRRDNIGMVHVRFDQFIEGIKVDGAQMLLHAKADTGEVVAMNGRFVSEMFVPELSALKRMPIEKMVAEQGVDLEITEAPVAAYVLEPQSDRTHLAWKVRVRGVEADGLPRDDYLFFDGLTGELVTLHANVHTAKSRRTYTANNGTGLPGSLLCANNQSCGGDSAAQDAHDFAGNTYDYYSTKFGRDSLNDNGMQLTSTVHYSSNYNNAFWSGSQMVYGDGDGTTFSALSGSLDVVAHELTHGVTDFESDLIYNKESGALNEALSDIFGAAVEAWVDGAISANTWRLGETIYTPNGSSTDALRYMNNPTNDGYSKDYYPERLYPGSCTPNSNTNDNCGVHGNSGIANLAFYLMVQGGSHPRGKTSVNVTAIGMDKAEQIFYRAQTQYLTASSNFEAARNATAQAADDLYGQTEVDRVHLAWDAVGAPGSGGGGGGGGGGGALQNGVPVSGLSGASGSTTFYTLSVPAGATDLSFAMSGGSGDADLYVRFGSAPTTSTYDCRPYKNGNNETCTFDPSQTGTYNIMIRAYSTFSGVNLEASYE